MTTHVDDADLETRSVKTFCRFCTALCGVVVTTRGDQVVTIRGDSDHPLSRGYTCPKGRALGELHHSLDRLDHPLMRRDGRLIEVSWEECLDDLGARIDTIREESGPDAIGMYLGTGSAFDAAGRRTAERWLQAIGSKSKYTSNTVDTPCKPLVSEMMSGFPGLVPAIDHERAGLTILIGLNPAVSHGHVNGFPDPVVRLRQLARQGELWVIDPRKTESARLAHRHIASRPGADYAILAYLVRELLRDGADESYLAAHASGVKTLRTAVERFDLATAAEISGVDSMDLSDLLAAIRSNGKVAAQTGTGTTMSAAANVTEWLTWALHIVTASYDRPGGMWFNPGYLRQMDNRAWQASDAVPGPGPSSRPELPQRWGEYPCAGLADEIETGNLRALLVVGANAITSLPDTGRLTAALHELEVLAVADIVANETSAIASHVLACAGPLERADLPHFVDQYQPEVATQYAPAVFTPGGNRRPMWWPFAVLAERQDLHVLPAQLRAAECTDDDLLSVLGDRSRTSFAELKSADGGVVSQRAVFGWVEEMVLPEGRWRLAPDPLVEQLASLQLPAPLVLTPRRQLRHLNGQLHNVPGMRRRDVAEVLMHPADAAEAGVDDGSTVRISVSNGELVAQVTVDDAMRRGCVSVPHGYAHTNVNLLTSAVVGVDPLTGMILQSGLPVRVEPV